MLIIGMILIIKKNHFPQTFEMGDAFELLTKYYFQIDPKLNGQVSRGLVINEIPQKLEGN